PLVEGHGAAAGFAGAPEGLAGPAVVPLDHRELALPGPQRWGEDRVGPARPAVQDQQDRVVAVLAAELDPLVDPADVDKPLLKDPVGGGDRQGLGDLALARLAPGQPTSYRRDGDSGRTSQNGSDH